MILPSEAVCRVVGVIVAIGPDVAIPQIQTALDKVVTACKNGAQVSDATLHVLELVRLQQLFSDVGAKAAAVEQGMRAATNNPNAADPPSAVPTRTLVEYFTYLQFEGN